jgi:peptide/nickel transport system ATP-binding protein
MMSVAMTVDRLTVRAGVEGPRIVDDVSLDLSAGEILGIVGESGSGKTTLGLAMLGYGRDGAMVSAGDVTIDGVSMVNGSEAEIASRRGSLVSYVPQDPAMALNPARRIGAHLREVLALGSAKPRRADALLRIRRSLEEMGLPSDDSFLRRYPHELSGGQQQRVLLSLAFLREPKVVVLDEPTTGLDVTTQAFVLDTIRAACARHDAAAVFVTHDLDVVASLAQRVLVLYGGRVCELGNTADLFDRPAHRYTAALLEAAPSIDQERRLHGIPGRAPRLSDISDGCAFAPRCAHADDACRERPIEIAISDRHAVHCHHPVPVEQVQSVRVARDSPPPIDDSSGLVVRGLKAGYDGREVVHGIDLDLRRGECVALVGESGSGKTTSAQCLAGLHEPSAGSIVLDGRSLARNARERTLEDRRALQYVFQNPFGSLNPRKTVGQLLEEPYELLRSPHRDIAGWIERVQLGRHVLGQRPRSLSGGERQRVAIARALTTEPEFLICDEITSALDVSIQASIVELLRGLQHETGVGILFVTHNLPLVASFADRVVVMRQGEVVEQGSTPSVLRHPATDYARDLIAAVPTRTDA